MKRTIRHRTKAWIRGVIVGALVIIIVAAWGTLSYSQSNRFCGLTCHEMKPFYDSWAESNHAQVKCYDCHAQHGFVGFFKTKVKGMKETYSHFFKDPSEWKFDEDVTNEFCTRCHEDANSIKTVETAAGTINVPHETHAFVECDTCHGGMVHGTEESRTPVTPSHDTCDDCHDTTDEANCGFCHQGF